MSNYFIMLLAFILGQALYTAITAYNIQKTMTIGWWVAVKAYVKKETGGYVVAIIGLAVLMFIITDFVDPSFNKADADISTWKGKLVAYFRTAMIGFGCFAQHLIFVAFKKGKKAIEKEEDKIDKG